MSSIGNGLQLGIGSRRPPMMVAVTAHVEQCRIVDRFAAVPRMLRTQRLHAPRRRGAAAEAVVGDVVEAYEEEEVKRTL